MAFLKLGLTAFGGPIAHLGYFHREFVQRRRWLDESQYAQLLALCQFLPGPASSQLGFALGLMRAGWAGALAAFCAFTLPSALLLFAFAGASEHVSGDVGRGALHGLKLAAVAVVAHAVLTMARALAPDRSRLLLAALACVAMLAAASAWAQLAVIATGAVLGRWLCPTVTAPQAPAFGVQVGRRTGAWLLLVFGLLLAAAATVSGPPLLDVAAALYRSGALVFGGGHVVLPLLEQAVVAPGWVEPDTFLAGYGAAQAMPGPMFAFAAFVGERALGGSGVAGAALCLGAIFLPGLLVVGGVLPFWRHIARRGDVARMLAGVNAAVVGLLAAALVDPLWLRTVHGLPDAGIAIAAFALLAVRAPALVVVLACTAGGIALAGVGAAH
ncbi:chromate efflux transporter [Chiayiivirga flava]|uniref:Chromate transporter n=1 Tax=Chiayiivirga flava TaxID=659595 RepID=A0A7W8D899_9GAMM|nr:chromate efflux transporter [Chiayiivirga flava]MBB5209774.1 chromate transporter [Chiayiivirga flava]